MNPNVNIVDFMQKEDQNVKSPFRNMNELVDMEDTEDRGVEIISIALDLGNGQQAQFKIHENDFPDKIARDVCEK